MDVVLDDQEASPVPVGLSKRSHGREGSFHHFPLDIFKIDRSFVAALGGGGEKAPLVPMIVDLGGGFGPCTVAEGVERIPGDGGFGEVVGGFGDDPDAVKLLERSGWRG